MIEAMIQPLMVGILKLFEDEFVKHEPEMQAALISYAKSLSLQLDEWAKSKLERKGQNVS
jgi:hypothetical protein